MMIQVILNIAVVTNTIPNTGITLPFISYGGRRLSFFLWKWGLYSAWPVGKIETLMMEHTGGTSMNEQVVQRDEKRKELKRTSAGRSSKDWEAGRRFLLPSFCFSSYFSVREIRVEGSDFLTEGEIRQYILEQGGDGNSLVLLLSTKFGDFPEPATVQSMKFHMVNPWTIRVVVKEKSPAGYVQNQESYIYFDNEGTVLGITDAPRDGVSLVEGLDVSKVEQGEKLPVEDSSIFEYIVQIQEILTRYKVSPDRIVTDGENITLYFGRSAPNLEVEIRKKRLSSFRRFWKSWRARTVHCTWSITGS